jgi:5,8-dihydroxy-2-naphthoate synthase
VIIVLVRRRDSGVTIQDSGMEKREITLGHSPDPDDAFMFYALATDKIDTGELTFRHIIEDIETLNRRALNAELDVTAVSIHAYAYVSDKYSLLTSGASVGDDYGPVVIARKPIAEGELRSVRIAIPGTMTTACLALRLCIGEAETIVVPFDKIMDAVDRGEADAGLLIHEGQLTYSRRGFHKVIDLGEWWKSETQLPLPLGGNAIKKSLGKALIERISSQLRESIEFGLAHREEAVRHSMKYGRGMEQALTDRFVGMYVNDFTIDYGQRGRDAVQLLLSRAHDAGIIPNSIKLEFC